MKKNEKLLDTIGKIDESLIPDLAPRKKHSKVILLSSIAVVCAAALLLLTLFPPKILQNLRGKNSQTESLAAAKLLASPNYPKMAAYPDESKYSDWDLFQKVDKAWRDSRSALQDQPTGYQTGYNTFFSESIRTLADPKSSENFVFSPISLYLALSMTAEVTDGQSRQQILDALHQSDIETLRANAKALFEANYIDDGVGKCLLANSLWTNSKCAYNQKTMDRLADTYYASAFTGDPTSPQYTSLFRSWINNQTDGLLSEYVDQIELDPQTILALASTVNYSGKWADPFDETSTKPSTFHAPNADITCDFLKRSMETTFFRGENFDSVCLNMTENGYMRLILPNEGTTAADLLSDEECMNYLLNKNIVPNKFMTVNLSLPKFDVSSSLKLKEGIEKLGVTDIFDDSRSNFTPLGDDLSGLYVSQAEQDVRVMIDEEGCKAAAVTVMGVCGSALPPDDKIDLTFDRPFLFEIVSSTGTPLFIGIVNTPEA